MLLSIQAIETYTPETQVAFLEDPLRQDAILMRLLDIGETMAIVRDKFPAEYQTRYADDFPKIIGLRNIIAHEYGEVDLAIVWQLLLANLPKFKSILQNWLQVL